MEEEDKEEKLELCSVKDKEEKDKKKEDRVDDTNERRRKKESSEDEGLNNFMTHLNHINIWLKVEEDTTNKE